MEATMTEITCTPLEALNEALCHEGEAQAFYLKAAERTHDPSGEKMFRDLAAGAATQVEIIERQIESLESSGKWTLPECVLSCEFDFEEAPLPRDRTAFEQAVGDATDETDAILFAIETVNAGFELYRRHAETTDDPLAQQLYEYLAEQAMTQRDLLMLSFEGTSSRAAWSA
jgi:rubrerythrin